MKSAFLMLFLTEGLNLSYTKTSSTRWSSTYFTSDRFAATPVNWVPVHSVVTFAKTKTGEYLPNWKNLVKSGSSATTPFDGIIQVGSSKPGHMKVNFWYPLGQPRQFQRPEWTEVEGHFIPPIAYPFSTGADVSSANSAALVQLAKAIERQNSHFMGGVLIGEIREVVRMITRPAKTLREGIQGYLSALNKRKSRAPKHRLKRILSDTWLEYSFGWQPLISDIKAAAETLARFQDEKDEFHHRRTEVRGFGKTQAVQSWINPSVNLVNSYCYYQQSGIDMAEAIVVYKAGMDYKTLAPVGSAQRLAQLSGLDNGLVGWIPTVWELLPWSFVVDYFSNIGDILSFHSIEKNNMTWINKSQVQIGYRRLNTVVDTRAVQSVISNKDLISIEGESLGSMFSKRTVVKRTAPSSLDYPQMEFRYPGLDSTKWINLAALWSGTRKLTPYRK